MSSSNTYSCWPDPRLQKQYEREFVERFSTSKYSYGASRAKYEDLIKRVGNAFGPNDRIRNYFEVKECSVNGEWIVRLVDKEQKHILLPLEDVFFEIESAHMKGNHKAKTPLLKELKQFYFNPSLAMVEFVLERCPTCLEKKKKETKVPDEPIHPNSRQSYGSKKESAKFQQRGMNIPQDPTNQYDKNSQVSVSVKAIATRAFNEFNNIAQSSTSPLTTSSSHGSLAPPLCLNSPIPFSAGKTTQSTFLTSTPVERNKHEKSSFVPSDSLLFSPNLSLSNNSRMSVDSNFIRFLNNSNLNQSGNQYLSIIREEQTMNHSMGGMVAQNNNKRAADNETDRNGSGRNSQQPTEEGKSSADKSVQSIGNPTGGNKVLPLAVQIKKEATEDFEHDSFHIDEELRTKILLELENESFGEWQKMQSRSNPAHQYYYNCRKGTSQNELPDTWKQEIKERAKKELNKQHLPPEKEKSIEQPFASEEGKSTDGNAKESLEFGEADKLTSLVPTVPFNDTNEAMEMLFALEMGPGNSAQNIPTNEDGMELKDICDMFQDQLAVEFEILDQGTVLLNSNGQSRTDAPENTENLNLANIPIEENICENDEQIDKAKDSQATPKIMVLNRQQLVECITPKQSEIPISFTKQKEVQTARKRSLRPKEAISMRTVETSNTLSGESSEEDVKRPPPLLVHKIPKCKVLIKCVKKTSAQKMKRIRPKKENLSSVNDVSFMQNTSRQNIRNSVISTPSTRLIKQELFQCVKCTRTRTFIGESNYYLHELSRHRNCVSANEYALDYMEKLTSSELSKVIFCCIRCDQTFKCANYWEHMGEKHDAKIGPRHRRILRIIDNVEKGNVEISDIKKEYLSDSDTDYGKDETWNGRDGEWAKLELGKKNRRKKGQGMAEKRVKMEVIG